ncbi:hypothetical protein SUGI_0142180 [Cryptomeria japonica]|nr:hypothetical protein SUGI_0142180 [Cryptomeria japonica]
MRREDVRYGRFRQEKGKQKQQPSFAQTPTLNSLPLQHITSYPPLSSLLHSPADSMPSKFTSPTNFIRIQLR